MVIRESEAAAIPSSLLGPTSSPNFQADALMYSNKRFSVTHSRLRDVPGLVDSKPRGAIGRPPLTTATLLRKVKVQHQRGSSPPVESQALSNSPSAFLISANPADLK